MAVLRNQMAILFKELATILCKYIVFSLAFIAASTSDTGKSLLKEQNVLMMSLVLIILFYLFLGVIGTILQQYNRTMLLPIITYAMVVLGSAVLVLGLSFISLTIALITLVLCVGMLALVAYLDYVVPHTQH